MSKGTLTERIKRTSTVESFRFVFDEKINFLPGQFCQVMFDEQSKTSSELNKYLSISSSPTKEYMEVTKKLSESEFSNRLRSLKESDQVSFGLPLGNCVFKDAYKKIGFLIGGIGITPVISIIEYIMDKGLGTEVELFYSNRRLEDIAFKKELDYWRSKNQNIKLFYTLTDSGCDSKDCILGRISKDLLLEKTKDFNQREFFIFGPPKMVDAMKNICLDMGCEQERIKTEKFIGY
ncbi:MAG: xylene monooxygenase [Candidatus Omnitrophica bacterium]|nr:xylene monooxygenase [Candidatus Omnitrophota bacterium]